jgi:hypothetical protein
MEHGRRWQAWRSLQVLAVRQSIRAGYESIGARIEFSGKCRPPPCLGFGKEDES